METIDVIAQILWVILGASALLFTISTYIFISKLRNGETSGINETIEDILTGIFLCIVCFLVLKYVIM